MVRFSVPGGNWQAYTSKQFFQITAQLRTMSGGWNWQTFVVMPSTDHQFQALLDNNDGYFVEGSSDSWGESAQNVIFTLRAEIEHPQHGLVRDVVDYHPGDVINVVHYKLVHESPWLVVRAGDIVLAIGDGHLKKALYWALT